MSEANSALPARLIRHVTDLRVGMTIEDFRVSRIGASRTSFGPIAGDVVVMLRY